MLGISNQEWQSEIQRSVVPADWSDASRATRCRVFKQVLTTDANFVAAATVTDSAATLSGLPSGKSVKVRVTGANRARERAPSAEVQVLVG